MSVLHAKTSSEPADVEHSAPPSDAFTDTRNVRPEVPSEPQLAVQTLHVVQLPTQLTGHFTPLVHDWRSTSPNATAHSAPPATAPVVTT